MRRPVSLRSAAEPVQLRIGRVGAEGDGVGALPGGSRLYVPLTLPGEWVRVPAEGAAQILDPSPERIAPPCPHFGSCGGCALQHWRDDAYAAWKTALLRDSLERAGFVDPSIAALARSAPGQRRRMDFAARRVAGRVALGLQRRGSHETEDLDDCLVLHPALRRLLGPLRVLLPKLQAMRREASVVANLLDGGVDLLLRSDAVADRADRGHLVAFAHQQGLVRISHAVGRAEAEPIAALQPAEITLSGVAVAVPAGGFLQATQAGEAAIASAVLAGLPARLGGRARVAEMFAGSGTLTFALAKRARVLAWEGDAAAAAALRRAANRAGLGGIVSVTQRDLARSPVPAAELAGCAAAVLDPPFAGAAAQTARIAEAKVPCVLYISCNPAVLARDVRLLHEAGYRLVSATPVDQFLWSARLEAVCVFGRS